MNSSGSAMKENETYMNSLQGKLSQLSSAFQKLSINTIDSDLVKWVLDFGTATIKLIDKMGGLPVVIGAVVSALLLFKGTLAIDKSINLFVKGLTLIKTSLISIKDAIPNAIAAWKSYSKGVITANTAMQAAAPLLSLIALGITGVIAAVNSYKKAQEEATQAAVEDIKQYSQESKSKEEQIEQLEKNVESLTKEKDAYLKNVDARNELTKNEDYLKAKQDEINKINENIEALKKEQKEKMRSAIISAESIKRRC